MYGSGAGEPCGQSAVDFIVMDYDGSQVEWHLCAYHWDRAQVMMDHSCPGGTIVKMDGIDE